MTDVKPKSIAPARMLITPEQCRAARALLTWSQEDLATRADVAPRSVTTFESRVAVPQAKTLGAIKATLEAAGIAFVNDAQSTGVVLRHPAPPS